VTRILPTIAVCLLAVASPTVAQEAPPVVPRDRLPVLGTVGDLPPERDRLIVEVLATGELRLGGIARDLAAFRGALESKSSAVIVEDELHASGLQLVIRADRDAAWNSVWKLLRECTEPKVRVHRIFFAAVPEDRGEEGAIAVYQPREPRSDRGISLPRVEGAPVRLLSGTKTDGPLGPTLHAFLEREWKGKTERFRFVDLEPDSDVTTGSVLETVDALLRWGARAITFCGSKVGPNPRAVPVARPGIEVFETPVGPFTKGDAGRPAMARAKGMLAGQFAIFDLPPEWLQPQEGNSIGIGAGADGAFGGRRIKTDRMAEEGGAETGPAVEAALDWLIRHQSPDGRWDADGFEACCKGTKCGMPGGPLFDPGVSALALLAFSGYGETYKTPRFGAAVRIGLKWLKGVQDADGCFGPRTSSHFVYNHAIATLAMCDMFGMTRSPLFKSSAQQGIDFILQCQNPYLAWRYGVRPGDNDTSVTAWMVWALDAGKAAGLAVEPASLDGARAWLDQVTDPATGRVGYTKRGNGPARPQELMDRFPASRTESMAALGVLTRMHCGADRADPVVAKGLDLLAKVPPTWSTRDGSIDFYYWHFGTMAMFHAGGDRWKKWNESMKTALVDHQRRGAEDDARGSWDPLDPWATEEGRVGATALNTLTLETYYRYRRIEKAK